MDLNSEPRSKLFDFDLIEAEDELEAELKRAYARYSEASKNKSEIEIHNYLQDKASQNKKEYNDVVSALLYGALTEPNKTRMFFQSISFVNRDNFASIVTKLQFLIMSIKFQSIRQPVRDQIFWIIGELTNLNVQNVDALYLCLMRQIRGGDLSPSNVSLSEHVLKMLDTHKPWLGTNPRVIATSVYTYLRIIIDHKAPQHQGLQQREIRFVINLMRDKWMLCVPIGRDLIRILYDLRGFNEFRQLWDDLLNNPQSISPRFKGIDTILKTPTPKEFLRSRITPDIEFKLLFILQNLRATQYQRNLNWFVQRFLSTAEAEYYYADVIRYIVAGWYPSNQILQSDIVPRYVVIGGMMRLIKNNVVLSNVKTALIYDWLFFTASDNIMFIEPAMLLMERSAERYPQITASIMEFLKKSADEFFPPLKDYMASCITCGMRALLSKGVIRSLMPIYQCPTTEPMTREYMRSMFSEFLMDSRDQQQSTISLPPTHSSDMPTVKSAPSTPKADTSYEHEEIDYTGNTAKKQQAAKLHSSTMATMKEDEDVDAYLYGDSDVNNEDADMTASTTEEKPDLPQVDALKDEDAAMSDANQGAEPTLEEPEPKGDEMVEEDESEEEEACGDDGLQSHQSYWIFGDSLKKFKSACADTILALKENDIERYNEQNVLSKKSLKEILAVFLRMAIPAEIMGSAIGLPVRSFVVANLLTHHAIFDNADSLDDEAVIKDPSKDVFDLIMVTFWGGCNNDASREKIIKLLSCIACSKKSNKTKRHLIGMRWWSFVASQMENEATKSIDVSTWFPNIVNNYTTYVLHSFVSEEAKSQDDYIKTYLKEDLQALADKDIVQFNRIIPLLYRYLPAATTGDLSILKLTILMLLPETLSQFVCQIHSSTLSVFGDQIVSIYDEELADLNSYETTCLWQFLAAELHGKHDAINSFFEAPQIFDAMQTNLMYESVPCLLSMLASISPSKDLICSVIKTIPDATNASSIQVQFVLASFQYWSINTPDQLSDAVDSLAIWLIAQLENDEPYGNVSVLLLNTFTIWWKQQTNSEWFKKQKVLLSNLYKLGSFSDYICPKEWLNEPNRKKKRAILPDSDEED
ncbi:protein-domain-containing protein [Blakeslea trispora]|nr:protein-domain-containing protein [Blakeslea trispora]